MKLTITIPNWNRAWHLDRSIYLISKQTIPQEDWELIIVDDGSTDDSEEVINKYKNSDIIKNFHYIKKVNKRKKYGNCAIARNIGAMAGSGDYILFTDPEVMPLPNWAEQHYLAHKRKIVKKPDSGMYTPVGPETVSKEVADRHVVGYCLQPREYHIITKNCKGEFLGNAYTDYDWFNIEGTWNEMERKIKAVQDNYQLSDRTIRDEFYIYQATQAGYSISRELFLKVRGFEENFSNASMGLDKWAGEDTLFHVYLHKIGIKRVELEEAKAIHIYHGKVCSNYDAVEYAHKYSKEHLDEWQSNLNREFGLVKENGFETIF